MYLLAGHPMKLLSARTFHRAANPTVSGPVRSPGSGQPGSGEYMAVGYQPVALSRSNSADYGMGLGGGVMTAFSWAPYAGGYPMYPGPHRTARQPLEGP
jgi:hypothetical protein